MKPQQRGYINKTRTMTIAMLTWKGEVSQNPIPRQRSTGKYGMLRAQERVLPSHGGLEITSNWLSNTKLSALKVVCNTKRPEQIVFIYLYTHV